MANLSHTPTSAASTFSAGRRSFGGNPSPTQPQGAAVGTAPGPQPSAPSPPVTASSNGGGGSLSTGGQTMGTLPGAGMAVAAAPVTVTAAPGDVPAQPRVRRVSGEPQQLALPRGPAASTSPAATAALANVSQPPVQKTAPPLVRPAPLVPSPQPAHLLPMQCGADFTPAPPVASSPEVPRDACLQVGAVLVAPNAARDAAVVAAEVEDLTIRLRCSEEALAEERYRSSCLTSELEMARSRAATSTDAGSEVAAELDEMRRYAAELEARGGLASNSAAVSSLGVRGGAELPPGAMMEAVRGGTSSMPTNGVNPVANSAPDYDAEVRALRAELAERDRELLAATTARRKAAGQSEKVAAALRAKLMELEAFVAATPSTSSRASSPHRSDCDFGGSPSVQALEVGGILEPGMQAAEMEPSSV